MTGLSYAAFCSAADHGKFDRALQVIEREESIEERAAPARICSAVIRWLGRMPPTSRWPPVLTCLRAMEASNAVGWCAFERALSSEFGEAAARFAIAAVQSGTADRVLTAGAVRLAQFHLTRHPEAVRRCASRHAGRSPALSPRKFEAKRPMLASRRGDPAVRLNAKVRLAGGTGAQVIMCRHLAMLWELEFLCNDGKVNYERFRTEEAIRRSLPPGMDSVTKARQFHSPECLRIVSHAEWGAELVRHFADMAERGETLRTIYVMTNGDSDLHAMMLGLKIRTDARAPNRRGYVVNLYDPNMTAAHVRAAVAEDPAALAGLRAEDFFPLVPPNSGKPYDYPVSWFSCPAASHWTLPNRFPDEFLVPFALWAALRMNHAAVIAECRARFEQMPRTTQGAFLLAQVDGTAGLFWALHKGHAEAIRAWGSLLAVSKLSSEARAELLSGRHADGDPGACFASTEALAAWDAAIDAAGLDALQRETLRALRNRPGAEAHATGKR